MNCIHIESDVIGMFQGADVEAVKDNFAFEFIPILLDVVMLDHDDNHVNVAEELIKIMELILCYLMVFEERVIAFEGARKVTLLGLKELEGRTLAEVINIFFVGQAIEAYAAIVCDVVLFHDFMDTVENKRGL